MELNLEFSQSMRLSQQMLITTQMIQSIEILQLQKMELKEKINQELAENPVLDVVDSPNDIEQISDNPEHQHDIDLVNESQYTDDDHLDPSGIDKNIEKLDDFDSQLEEYVKDDYYSGPSVRSSDDEGDKMSALQNLPTRAPSLQEHLRSQLCYFDISDRIYDVAEYIIYNVADDGYLYSDVEHQFSIIYSKDPLEEILASYHRDNEDSDWTLEDLQEGLDVVQALDPPGVGARDLRECLLLQLLAEPKRRPFEETLVRDHLEDILHNRFPKVAKEMSCEIEQVKEAVILIGSLHPKPGILFGGELPKYIVPDVIVEKIDGQFVVKLSDGDIPQLHISEHYKGMLDRNEGDAETKKYVRNKIKAAQWLIQAIEQRNSTLLKTAESIVKYQIEYFEKGINYIKPLMMQQVADDISMHVSTVSRAVSNKYIQSIQGIYGMRDFFTGGYQKADGSVESDIVIQQYLKDIIESEDPHNPLSDESISKIIKEKHEVKIARRTVAKYRQQLGIPSTRKRKQY